LASSYETSRLSFFNSILIPLLHVDLVAHDEELDLVAREALDLLVPLDNAIERAPVGDIENE
jgi:translation elongation factor EF-Tu-like GTPase